MAETRMISRQSKFGLLPPCIKTVTLVICLFSALPLARLAPEAQAQDILIVRPLNNNQTVATKQEIDFEVVVSSFAPVIEVKFNGEPQPLDPAPTVIVSKSMRLERGINTILVQVATEFETAEKEFEIRFGKPEKKKRPNFQLITMLGAQQKSNPLKLKDGEIAGTRTFLVLVPRYDWFFGKRDTLRLQSIIARDSYDKEELAAEEVALTQLTLRWIDGNGKNDLWTLGVGYDSIVTETADATDAFLFTDFRWGFGEGPSYFEFGLEWKQQEFEGEPDDAFFLDPANPPDPADPALIEARNNDEDAQVVTLRSTLQSELWTFKSKLKFEFSTLDADGKFKDKDTIKLSEQLSKAFGAWVLGFGLRAKQNSFKESNPQFGDVAPSETLLTFFFNSTVALSKSWLITAEVLTESQTSNVDTSEYDNTALSLAIINVF